MDEYGGITCKTCPFGYECLNTANPTGTDLPKDMIQRCQPHIQGPSYYCPAGVAKRVSCNAGYYTFQDRASTSADCLICPKGYYCQTNPPD